MSHEASLAARARGGDSAAYEQLVLRHAQSVRRVAASFDVDWEDIVQETFLRAFADIRRLKDPDRFREWLIGIARNVCRDELKRRKRRGPQLPVTPRPEAADPALEELRLAVDALPDEYREVIELRHFERLSHAEIGRRLGLGLNGVNARLTRARAMLREKMRPHGKLPD